MTHDVVRIGYDAWGVTHIPGEGPPVVNTEAMCAGTFSECPIDVRVVEMPLDTPLTCFWCVVRFGWIYAVACRRQKT